MFGINYKEQIKTSLSDNRMCLEIHLCSCLSRLVCFYLNTRYFRQILPSPFKRVFVLAPVYVITIHFSSFCMSPAR